MKEMILGGIRSGKSRYAEQLAVNSSKPVTYIATATAGDDEMVARIAVHKQHRPANWTVIEEPVYLADALRENDSVNNCSLVDCLTLWLTNLLCKNDPILLKTEQQKLINILTHLSGHIILVSNETNMGVIPANELSRRFCDEAGALHQELAKLCDRVILTVAGLPHAIKGNAQ